MLRPTKHSHPDQTVVNLAMILLKKIKKGRSEDFDKLIIFAKKNVGGGEFLFIPALNFLYLLGLIEYTAKNDSIEYVGPK